MTLLLVVLWYIQYTFGVLGENDAVNTGTTIFLTVAALYCLFGSPFLHRDTLSSWGLGNPVALWRRIREGEGATRYLLAATVMLLTLGLTASFSWVEVADFRQDEMNRPAVTALTGKIGRDFGFTVGVLDLRTRYDNFSRVVYGSQDTAVVGYGAPWRLPSWQPSPT